MLIQGEKREMMCYQVRDRARIERRLLISNLELIYLVTIFI